MLTEPIVYEHSWTKAELTKLSRRASRRTFLSILVAVVVMLPVPIIEGNTFAGGLVAGICLMFSLFGLSLFANQTKVFDALTVYQHPIVITVSEEGFENGNSEARDFVTWRNYVAYEELPTAFTLRLPLSNSLQVIPKQGLTSHQIEQIRDLLVRKIAKK